MDKTINQVLITNQVSNTVVALKTRMFSGDGMLFAL
jgi:hypothetical protein